MSGCSDLLSRRVAVEVRLSLLSSLFEVRCGRGTVGVPDLPFIRIRLNDARIRAIQVQTLRKPAACVRLRGNVPALPPGFLSITRG